MNIKIKIKKFDITSHPPFIYAFFYLVNVILFSLIYSFLFSNDFKGDPINFIQSLYFSVVTVTTLGYGDLTPKLDSTLLLLTITTQVVLGVINIGLFLNAISQKLSDRKDDLRKEYENEIEEKNLAKLLTILKPTFISYLEILSETYKVTTPITFEEVFGKIPPRDLFKQRYYDQISRQNFFSKETRYGSDVMTWGQFIDQENSKFTAGIDDFLNKFSMFIPIELIETLVDLKSHLFLNYCRNALLTQKLYKRLGIEIDHEENFMTIEHSSTNIPESDKPKSIRDFHEKYLFILSLIEEKTKCEKIFMPIDLRKNVTAPPVGSAIVSIMKFGPYENTSPKK